MEGQASDAAWTEVDRITAYFAAPEFRRASTRPVDVAKEKITDPAYGEWLDRNLHRDRRWYVSVTISLSRSVAPG